MKKNLHVLSLFITISFFSCNSADKNPNVSISNISADFPISEKLEFKPFNKYDIFDRGSYMIDDSILWYFEDGEHNFGFCYDLTTGKKLSMIASRGKATYELIDLEGFKIIGDSVQLYTRPNTIKTFAKKDIVENKPMGERKFSVATIPDSIFARRMIKLPNGSVIATIETTLFGNEINKKREINKKSVVLFNKNEANSYETIKYNSEDVQKGATSEIDTDELIKCAYADGDIEIKENDMAVFSVANQFILYTFDINSGNVVKEKRYTKIQSEGGTSLSTKNDMDLQIRIMKPNDKYILCGVDGYFSEEDKELKLRKNAIFVFDWDLNPIKRFDFPDKNINYYTISSDCKSVYFGEYTDENLTLYKADLTI